MKSMLALSLCLAATASMAAPMIVPAPRLMTLHAGSAELAAVIETNKQGKVIRNDFVLPRNAVTVVRDASLPAEGYELVTEGGKVSIKAADDAGEFYARKTLSLLPEQRDGKWFLQNLAIKDYPKFSWRGVHVDEGRHFFGKHTVKKILDAMALNKMNVLHWHLTEDQGWRLAIDKYPELIKYGAIRSESPRHRDCGNGDGKVYGPFYYTKDDVREILAYARERHIRVMPEIELPGHSGSVIAAYPSLHCFGAKGLKRDCWTRWGVTPEIICAGNDDAIKFYEGVLDEVCELFPNEVVHIGGDEAPKTNWKKCPKCQARMKANNLKNEEELQGWLTQHFVDYLAKKGRRAMGWDEIMEGKLADGAIVMSWRGAKGGIEAAKMNHDVVMTPASHCYHDFPQGVENDPFEYATWSGPVSLRKTYSYDPLEGIPEQFHKHVLGAQSNNWNEYTWEETDLLWKMWPRAAAIGEVLWTGPGGNYEYFAARMKVQNERMRKFGVYAAPVTK